jgi:polyhydroxyalkanoate synthase
MADEKLTDTNQFRLPDPALVTRTMSEVAERGQRIVADFLKRQEDGGAVPDPLNIGGAFLEMTTRLMANPASLVQAQLGFWQDYLTLWQNTARRMMGAEAPPVITEDPRDRRFKDEAWRENEVFDFIKQSYLLSARYFQTVVGSVEGLDHKTAQKVDFYTRQVRRRDEPVQLPAHQPGGAAQTAETGGENLLKACRTCWRTSSAARASSASA